jgi:hypothetical protein
MTGPLSPVVLVLFLLTVALFWRRSLKQPNKNLPLPPGPKQWPFIGSLLQMPRTFEWETYREWSQRYGEYSFPLYDYTKARSDSTMYMHWQVQISFIRVYLANQSSSLISMKLPSSFSTKGVGFTRVGTSVTPQRFLKCVKTNL